MESESDLNGSFEPVRPDLALSLTKKNVRGSH